MYSSHMVEITLWIFLQSYIRPTEGGIPTYLMRDYCERDLNMMVLNINAGRLLLARDQNEARDCAVTVVSWYSNPYIQIQFEGLDLKGRYLTLNDGGETSKTVTGLPRQIIGMEAPKGSYSTTTRFLRIYLSQFQYSGDEDKSEFSIVFNSFDTGSCSSSEYDCANGLCISKELQCNGYNPCGDSSDCVLSKAVVVAMALGSVAAIGAIVTTIVCLVLYRRRRTRRANENEQQGTTNSAIVVTLAEDLQDDSPPTYIQVMSSPNLYVLRKTSTFPERSQRNLDDSSTA